MGNQNLENIFVLVVLSNDNSVKTSDEDYDTINGKAIRKLYYNNSEFAKETKTTDKLGRLSGITYADGNKQSFRYDGFGELVQEDDSLQDKSIL